MTIHLYAEHLVNIRALSLQVSLSTVSNTETEATLSGDGCSLTLAHEGEVASIKLPFRLPGKRNVVTLTLPAVPTKDLSFRLRLDEKLGEEGLLPNTHQDDGNIMPWTAHSLGEDCEIACRRCTTVLVKRGSVKAWKDLPSENWAEMMDFWHCHRPDVPHDSNPATAKKGYSADSKLAIETGVGMLDPVNLLLASRDCGNVNCTEGTLTCATCQAVMGTEDASSGGCKLRKVHLSISPTTNALQVSYAPAKWLACHLLSSIETQGVRKFKIHAPEPDEAALECWVFTPDLHVSSSASEVAEPMRAVKIFWQHCDAPTNTGQLNRQTLFEGELELAKTELEMLQEALQGSARLLPESARKFQEWDVALLPRFTAAEVDGMADEADAAALSDQVEATTLAS